MDIRTFTATLSLPAGTAAGSYEQKTVLDSTYQRASGFAVYKNKDGGVPSFKLGLRDDTAVYAAPTHVDFYAASTDCPKNQRLTPANIPCNNTNLVVQFVLPFNLTSELNIDLVFQLEGLKSNAR